MKGYARRRADRRGYNTPAGALPSVTTILGATSKAKGRLEAWKTWMGDDAEWMTEAACKRGTWTHSQIEAWIQGQPTGTHFAFGRYWQNIRPWLEAHFVEAWAIEQAIWHPKGFSGTFDCLGYAAYGNEPEALTLIDWKTAERERPLELLEDSYFLQLGAYSAGLQHSFGIKPERALLVIARPHINGPDLHEVSAADLDKYEQAFYERLTNYYTPNTNAETETGPSSDSQEPAA